MMHSDRQTAQHLARNYDDMELFGDERLLIDLAKKSLSDDVAVADIDDLTRGINVNDLKQLGARILNRWAGALQELVCGNDEKNAGYRQEFVSALTGNQAIGPIIAGIAVAALGLSAPIAAIVGTLVARCFVEPAVNEVCVFWAHKLREDDEKLEPGKE